EHLVGARRRRELCDADRNLDVSGGILAVRRDLREEPYAKRAGLGDRRQGKQHREFVAAEARENIGRPQVRGDDTGHGEQRAVSGLVAVAVVDRLQVVEIDAEDAGGSSDAAGPAYFLGKSRAEISAIEEPGERIRDRGEACLVVPAPE